MSLRQWLRKRLGALDDTDEGPPGSSLMRALWGGGEERIRALGDFDAQTYPAELAELVRRRQAVAESLLEIDVANPEERVAAIPRLREMLRVYPHPLVYETLIHAYVDAGRHDEARGVAFAARERRTECASSEYPEIRSEIEHLSEWTPEDVEVLWSSRTSAPTAR